MADEEVKNWAVVDRALINSVGSSRDGVISLVEVGRADATELLEAVKRLQRLVEARLEELKTAANDNGQSPDTRLRDESLDVNTSLVLLAQIELTLMRALPDLPECRTRDSEDEAEGEDDDWSQEDS